MAPMKEHNHGPYELKVAKNAKDLKKGGGGGGCIALKLCLKGEQERQKPAVGDGRLFSGGTKKGKGNLLTGKEEQTLMRGKEMKRVGFRDQISTRDRLNSPQSTEKIYS